MKQVFIDTNILIYCTLLTKEGHDSGLITRLSQLLDHGLARLILPEIIELEYQRKINEVFQQVRLSIGKLKDSIGKQEFPSYLAGEKKKILEHLDSLIASREENKVAVSRSIDTLFRHGNTVRIPLTPEIALDSYRRAARGIKPFNLENTFQGMNADCLIVESLRVLYRKNGDAAEPLLFCSNNSRDFSLVDSESNHATLHPDVANDLNATVTYYFALPNLLQKEFKVELSEIDRKLYEDSVKILQTSWKPLNPFIVSKNIDLSKAFHVPNAHWPQTIVTPEGISWFQTGFDLPPPESMPGDENPSKEKKE